MVNTLEGLSLKEVRDRVEKYGYNEIKEDSTSVFKILLNQITSPLVYLLIISSVISLFTGDITGASIIFAILAINTILGFIQEYRSNETFERLKKYISSNVTVIRENKEQQIDKKYLVPDDIVIYKLGDIIGADCFVLKQQDLLIDESSITGESEAVYKKINENENKQDKDSTLYSGSYVIKGKVFAKVFAIGSMSKFGKISELSVNTKKISEYQENIEDLSKGFSVIAVISLIIILGLHFILDKNFNLVSLMLFTLAIAITIIPEALPVISTLTLAKGALNLSKKQVITKKAASIEDLGNIDVICTDKTGTLTQNKLDIVKFISENDKEFFLNSILLSTNSTDPFDVSIYAFAMGFNDKEIPIESFQEIPFDPKLRFSGRKFLNVEIIKGSPEYILDHFNSKDKDNLLSTIQSLSAKGYRPLSLGIENNNKKKYLGTYFFEDKIKDDAAHAIKLAEKEKIFFKVITGDSLDVAIHVAKNVKLITDSNQAISAEELNFNDPKILFQQVEKYNVFARTDPVQKYNIIKSLKEKYHVGYLGDGINDAPSLKIATVGMAVDTASEIAKSNADIILLNKDLTVIVNGIIEGRKIFANINKYLRLTLASNFGNLYTIGLISLFLNFLPILPIQILINNLLCDIPYLAVATDNVDNFETRKPAHHTVKNLIIFSTILGIVSALFSMTFYFIIKDFSTELFQSSYFIFASITEPLIIFSRRSKLSIFKSCKPSKLLTLLTVSSITLVLFIGYFGLDILKIKSIGLTNLSIIIVLSLAYIMVNEIVKFLYMTVTKHFFKYLI